MVTDNLDVFCKQEVRTVGRSEAVRFVQLVLQPPGVTDKDSNDI